MQQYLENNYRRFILEQPKTVLFLLLCLFIAAVYHARDFRLDASADSLLLEDDKALKIFREVNERYQSRDFLFITFTPHEALFSEASFSTIRQLRDEVRQLDFVESVISLIDVPLIEMVEGNLSDVVDQYMTLENGGLDKQAAKEELLRSPVYSNQIISADAGTTALIINLKPNTEYFALQKIRNQLLVKKQSEGLTADEQQALEQNLFAYEQEKNRVDQNNHEGIAQLRAILDKYRNTGELHLGGVPMIADDMISFIKGDLLIFGIGVFVFLIIMLSIIFRQLRWVILPLLSCVYSGLIMVGLLGLMGWRVTVISSNFISLMLILTMSMNIHLIVRYRELHKEDSSANQIDLVLLMLKRMVRPCLYTALTTMIGFSSLFVSNIKPVIDFGWMMTIGLGVAFLTTFLLFPVILVLLKKTDASTTRLGPVPFTGLLARTTEKHGNKIILGSAVFAVVSIFGVMQLKVENSFINYFSDSTEIYQGQKLIDEKLGGTAPLDVVLKFDAVEDEFEEEDAEFDALFGEIQSDKADTWFTSSKLEQIKQVHDYLDAQPEIGKVMSLASFVRLAESLNRGQAFEPFELAVIYKRMPDEMKTQMLDPYISIEHDEARINMRILDSQKELRRKELIQRIEEALVGELSIEQDRFQVTGLLVLYNNMLQSLFQSQIQTLGVVMLGIAMMLLVLFRSFLLALIGIIPNMLAAIMILGLMGLARIPLDMMTITIAAITIGIAVDDCIHYIYRFREEFPKHGNYVDTLHACHANIGRAMFYTSLTVIIGFSILVMSNFIPTIYFGVLTTLAMAIALLAALTLLPKLILIFKPF